MEGTRKVNLQGTENQELSIPKGEREIGSDLQTKAINREQFTGGNFREVEEKKRVASKTRWKKDLKKQPAAGRREGGDYARSQGKKSPGERGTAI